MELFKTSDYLSTQQGMEPELTTERVKICSQYLNLPSYGTSSHRKKGVDSHPYTVVVLQ